MLSTMQDRPLTINSIFEHSARVHADSVVSTFMGETCRLATYQEVAGRAARLASALKRLGVNQGDRVGTFMWNSQEHLEAYFAIPSMGAVLHTLNLRLFPEQLEFVIKDADDKVIFLDKTLVPVLDKLRGKLDGVRAIVVLNDGGPLPEPGLGEVHD